MTCTSRRIFAPTLLSAAALLASATAGPLEAQPVGANSWTPLVGCWQPEGSPSSTAVRSTVCFVPDGSGVQVIAIENSSIGNTDMLPASGAARIERDGCTGDQTVQTSADRRRIFVQTDLACTGDFDRTTSAIYSMTSDERWIATEAIDVGGETSVRTLYYRPVPADNALTPAQREEVSAVSFAVETARIASASAVDVEDIVEANTIAGTPATEAWLLESNLAFVADAAMLNRLADAELPESVIDLVVALSYPNVFAIDRGAREGERMADAADGRRYPRRGGYPWYYPVYGRGFYPGYYGGYYGRPVVIVRDGAGRPDRDNGGRAVNGRGYTRSRGSGSSDSPSPPQTSTGRDNGGSDTRTSTGRTAKPRE